MLTAVTDARANVGAHQGDARSSSTTRRVREIPGGAGRSCQRALSRLLVVVENYPNLKSDALFRDLQSQLEGTENRITVARNRYIESVQDFNTTVRSFPTNLTAMLFRMDVKPNFTVENEVDDREAADGRLRQAAADRAPGKNAAVAAACRPAGAWRTMTRRPPRRHTALAWHASFLAAAIAAVAARRACRRTHGACASVGGRLDGVTARSRRCPRRDRPHRHAGGADARARSSPKLAA